MASLGSIFVGIRAKTDKYKRDLEKAKTMTGKAAVVMKKQLDKINFKRIGVAAVASAAIVVVALKKVIDAAKEQEAVEKRLESVLRSTGMAAGFNIEQMKGMAAAMQEVTTVGDETILSGMAMLATFKQIRGEGFERTMAAALDLSEVMQQDLRSSIVMLGKALNDPVANLGALSRAGIQFTKDQKEVIKALFEGGKQAEAQSILLDELESQFGGAAIAARNTFGGAMKAAGNALGDVHEQIGFAITKNEVLIDLVKEAEQVFIDVGEAVGEWVNANDKLIAQKTHEAISKIKSNIENIVTIFNSLPDGVVGAAGFGLIGRILTGSTPIGAFVTGMVLLNSQLKKLSTEGERAAARLIQAGASAEEIRAAAMGTTLEGDFLFPVPRRPTEIPTPTFTPPPPATPLPGKTNNKEALKNIQEANRKKFSMEIALAELIKKDTFLIRQEGLDAALLQQADNQTRQTQLDFDALQERLRIQEEFNIRFEEMNLSQFDLERLQLERLTELYEQAGVDKARIAEITAAKIAKIDQAENQAKLQIYKQNLNSVTSMFQSIAQAGGQHSKEAFTAFKAFAIAEAIISANLAAAKVLGQTGIFGIPLASFVWGSAMLNVAQIAATQPPSFDDGGISQARGIYQTGPIREAHIPIPSGGRIPVNIGDGGGERNQPMVQVILKNPVFQDLETQRQAMAQIAGVIAEKVAPGAVVRNFNNDGEIRSMVRGG